MEVDKDFNEVSISTAANLKTVYQTLMVSKVSHLSLPEIDPVVNQTARLIPAGNVPGLILSGLRRLPGRKLSSDRVRRDINLLFKGIEQTLDTAVYGAFFAGPAAVIWGYQNLLKLSGKAPEDAFPEGPWQFYVDYAMREDTARHANETHGFDTALDQRQIRLKKVDRMTAWVMAAIHCLHAYDALLSNEWSERIYTHLLTEVTKDQPDARRYAQLYRQWQNQLPYGLPDAVTDQTYPVYRRQKFDQFLAKMTSNLPADLREAWLNQIRQAETEDLPAYRQQMSILAYLDPGRYGEARIPLSLANIQVGVIHQGRYCLIPACEPGTEHPSEVQTVQSLLAALLRSVPEQQAGLTNLAEIKRSQWPELRRQLGDSLIENFDRLRQAPILLNFDLRSRQLSLCELRQAERGLGDHALTIFDTGETFVFDQSHIFFDGAWGVALAEIMTQQALRWAFHLNALEPPQSSQATPVSLSFKFQTAEMELIRRAARVTHEVSAEADAVDLRTMFKLRRLFKQRNDLLQLTINDLLILYRAIHAVTYHPRPELVAELKSLSEKGPTRAGALCALEELEKATWINPAVVIPIDASRRSPRDRLYPVTFEVPLKELNLLDLHHQAIGALDLYETAIGDRTNTYTEFDRLQRVYLRMLAHFGQVLSRLKEIGMAGESLSMGALKLLAHLPTPLQRLLDKAPGRFEVLNDLIKGREAFSNVGAVVPSSTLTRFVSAKDDNDKKTLVWGVLTDAQNVMHISLRDFRPHVSMLIAAGQKELASRLAQDYLDGYVQGLNAYIYDLYRITKTSRETRLNR